jgi:hypothetical protein
MPAKPLLFTAFLAAPVFAQSGPCEKLASLSLPEGTITLTQPVGAGEFTPAAGPPARFQNLPAFCRVTATLVPSKDSDIKIEVWLPASGWNGKFQAAATAAGRVPSTRRRSPQPCAAAMPLREPTPAIPEAAPPSPSRIPKSL